MSGDITADTKTFCFDLGTRADPLSFEVTLYKFGDEIYAKILVTEGYADYNAIYWGDSTTGNSKFGGSSGRESSLNMNGAQGSTQDGRPVEWDGATKLGLPGLGRLGTDKPTFIGAGDFEFFKLEGVTSFDQVASLGVRATSTSTPEGSIKAIGACRDDDPEDDPKDDDPKDDPKDDDPKDDDPKDDDPKDDDPKDDDPKDGDRFPEWPQDISNVVFHFDTDGDGEIDYWVKVDDFGDDTEEGRDLDDCYDCMLSFVRESDPDLDPEATLVGVSIKGGTQETQFFRVEGNQNGAEPDPDAAPDNLKNTGPGVDTTLAYNDFLRYAAEACTDPDDDEEDGGGTVH